MKLNGAFSTEVNKKMTLVCLLKKYAIDRNIESFSKSLSLLLVSYKHQDLIMEIR